MDHTYTLPFLSLILLVYSYKLPGAEQKQGNKVQEYPWQVYYKNESLKKKNELLQKENQKLYYESNIFLKNGERLEKNNNQLKEENQQLKAQLTRLSYNFKKLFKEVYQKDELIAKQSNLIKKQNIEIQAMQNDSQKLNRLISQVALSSLINQEELQKQLSKNLNTIACLVNLCNYTSKKVVIKNQPNPTMKDKQQYQKR